MRRGLLEVVLSVPEPPHRNDRPGRDQRARLGLVMKTSDPIGQGLDLPPRPLVHHDSDVSSRWRPSGSCSIFTAHSIASPAPSILADLPTPTTGRTPR